MDRTETRRSVRHKLANVVRKTQQVAQQRPLTIISCLLLRRHGSRHHMRTAIPCLTCRANRVRPSKIARTVKQHRPVRIATLTCTQSRRQPNRSNPAPTRTFSRRTRYRTWRRLAMATARTAGKRNGVRSGPPTGVCLRRGARFWRRDTARDEKRRK